MLVPSDPAAETGQIEAVVADPQETRDAEFELRRSHPMAVGRSRDPSQAASGHSDASPSRSSWRRRTAGIAVARDGMTGWQPSWPAGWHFPSHEGIRIHCMAQRIQTLLIDDLDGGEAAGTVRFGLDGTEYEIDLSAAHYDARRKALQHYVAHARRTGGTARTAARSRRGSAAVDTAKVREWAKSRASRSRTAAASRPTSSSSTRRPQEHNPGRPRDVAAGIREGTGHNCLYTPTSRSAYSPMSFRAGRPPEKSAMCRGAGSCRTAGTRSQPAVLA